MLWGLIEPAGLATGGMGMAFRKLGIFCDRLDG